jgi:hypothetical protein
MTGIQNGPRRSNHIADNVAGVDLFGRLRSPPVKPVIPRPLATPQSKSDEP